MKRLCVTLLLTIAVVAAATNVGAQQDNGNAKAPQGATITEPTKSYVVEGVGVAALFGAALFAVCRSSFRGR